MSKYKIFLFKILKPHGLWEKDYIKPDSDLAYE